MNAFFFGDVFFGHALHQQLLMLDHQLEDFVIHDSSEHLKENCGKVFTEIDNGLAQVDEAGLKKGSSPSSTSISAQAASSRSQALAPTAGYFLAGAAAAGAGPEPRIARKNSLLGSITITSPLLRKLAR